MAFLLSAGIGLALSGSVLRAQPPHIVFVLADDLGYGSAGFTGQADREAMGEPFLRTPALDALAAEGCRFDAYYAGASTCAPSRASLMTGWHTGHVNVRANRSYAPGNEPLDSVLTLPGLLRQSGYRTVAIGKWGLGGEPGQGWEGHPLRRGFDRFVGVLDQAQCHQQYLDRVTAANPDGGIWDDTVRIRPGVDDPERYANRLFGRRAREALDTLAGGAPFFLYVAFTTPHARLEAPPEGWPAFVGPRPWPDHEKDYAAMVASLDEEIGRLAGRLDSLGVGARTLFIVTSDNGPHDEAGLLGTTPPHDPSWFGESGPFRGKKRQHHEGGIRVPLVLRWPEAIPAGTRSARVTAAWDWWPTLADLAGVTAESRDGRSFADALRPGTASPVQEPFALYWEFVDNLERQAVRMGDWKAIRKGIDAPLALYHLGEDPGEERDLAAAHPERAAFMARCMACLRDPCASFPSALDGLTAECPPADLGLVSPLPGSRLVGDAAIPRTLEWRAALREGRIVEVHLEGPNGALPVVQDERGRWWTDWRPGHYGWHPLVWTVTDEEGNRHDITEFLQVAPCSLAVSDATPVVLSVSSEERDAVDAGADRAFDGDPETRWHTQWFAADPPHPHHVAWGFDESRAVAGVRYRPRKDASPNGIVTDWVLTGGLLGYTDTLASGTWTWSGDSRPDRTIRFPARVLRYLRFEALAEISGGPWTSASEIETLVEPCPESLDTVWSLAPGLVVPAPQALPGPLPVRRGSRLRLPLPMASAHWVSMTGQTLEVRETPPFRELPAPDSAGWWWLVGRSENGDRTLRWRVPVL